MLAPADLAAIRDALLDTSGPLAVAGAGTASRWGGSLGPVDTVLDTTALSGVIVHNPGDMTVAVRAGTPLRELQAELAPHGQHVALDAARVARGATVGGLIATGDAGPGALVHGSLRDLVIGVTLVLADGTVARSGGHVIKNVAGYDLAKLLHGSYGTLAVLAEVVLRLHPVPRATSTVTLPCALDEADGHAGRVLASPLEPMALEWCSAGPGTAAGQLLVRLEGTPDALPGRIERLRALLGATATATAPAAPAAPAAAAPAEPAPAEPDERHSRPTGPHESAGRPDGGGGGAWSGEDAWSRHAALVDGAPGLAVLRVGVRPAVLAGLLASLPAQAVTAGLGTGVATVTLPAEPDAIRAAHAAVHAAGGTSALRDRTPRDRPGDLDAPAWGPPPSAVGVLRAVKRAFDPAGRLGPGRFSPWLEG
ncbi:MAG: FAD-binding oxidoreductase [Pseudonocardia sp.]